MILEAGKAGICEGTPAGRRLRGGIMLKLRPESHQEAEFLPFSENLCFALKASNLLDEDHLIMGCNLLY